MHCKLFDILYGTLPLQDAMVKPIHLYDTAPLELYFYTCGIYHENTTLHSSYVSA